MLKLELPYRRNHWSLSFSFGKSDASLFLVRSSSTKPFFVRRQKKPSSFRDDPPLSLCLDDDDDAICSQLTAVQRLIPPFVTSFLVSFQY
jgi:hypothetical protein